MNLYSLLMKLVSDVEAGNAEAAWADFKAAGDILLGSGGAAQGTRRAANPQALAPLKTFLDQHKAELEKCPCPDPNHPSAKASVQAIGDGSLLKALIALFQQLAPILIPLIFGGNAPTPAPAG